MSRNAGPFVSWKNKKKYRILESWLTNPRYCLTTGPTVFQPRDFSAISGTKPKYLVHREGTVRTRAKTGLISSNVPARGIGDELQFIQFGGMPEDSKPFKGVGSGVIEIAVKFNKDAYRCVQAIQLGTTIY